MTVSLREVGDAMFRHYGAGRYDLALDVVQDALSELPPADLSTVVFWKICLLNLTNRSAEAVDELRSALDRGWWYGEQLLRGDDDLASLQGRPEWESLVEIALSRQESASTSPPEGDHQLVPEGVPAGSVVALHASGGRVSHTADTWGPVTALGYDLHVPGSSQRISVDRASWDARETAYRDVLDQVGPRLRTSRVIVAGRSQGARRAAEIASRRLLPVAGVVLVALAPSIDEAPDVDVPAYCIAGMQDRPEFVDAIERFAGHQASRAVPVHVERIADMGHMYPEPFTPHLEAAVRWLERV